MLFSYFWFAGRFCCRINIVVRLRATLTVAKTMRLYNIHSILKATKTIRISQIVDSLTRYVHLSYVSSEYALSFADKIISAAIVCSLKCFIGNTLTRQRASYWLHDCEFAKKKQRRNSERDAYEVQMCHFINTYQFIQISERTTKADEHHSSIQKQTDWQQQPQQL